MSDQHPKGFPGMVGRFFFSPTDPTTLGFMRIMTGLILLYVHAAYSLDMNAFLGPNAWWDHQAGNIQRREVPQFLIPTGWSNNDPTLRYIDEVPHRRNAMIEFMRDLPSDSAARKAKLRHLNRTFSKTPREAGDGLSLANSASKLVDPKQDQRVRDALAATPIPDAGLPVFIPEYIRELPTAQERQAAWDDVLAFISVLPNESEKQEYVLTWIGNYPHSDRMDLYRFLVGEKSVSGKDMSLPADPEAREEFLGALSRWGTDTRQAHNRGMSIFSHWYHLTDRTTMACVHAVSLVVFFLFTIGLWTRVTSVLSWAISIAYIHRSQVSLFGQDTMQTILVTYLMISPCGTALSIDAIRARYRAAKALFTNRGRPAAWATNVMNGPQPSWLANLAVRLFQINFCLIYLSSGISKLKGNTWWMHEAPWLVMINPEFGLIRYQAYEWLVRQFAEWRLGIAVATGSISLFTLVLEIGFPFFVWTRLRPLAVVGSIMLHLGIGVIMGLTVFSMYMFTLALCYFPARLIRDRVAWAPGSGKKMTLHYDSRETSAVRKAALIRALDIAGQVTFIDTASKGTMGKTVQLTDPNGNQSAGSALFHTALRELVLVRPIRLLGFIPGVWPLINAVFGR